MRTKTLLLSAVIGAAGITSAMAQTVYSVNIVGYINLTLQPGLSLIANQLDASPNNRVGSVFGSPASTLSISKFNPATGSFALSEWDPDRGSWSDETMTLDPGEGAFADNPPGAGPLTITLVGQVRLSSTVSFTSGLKIVSSVIPQAGPVSPDLGFPIPGGQFTISKFNRLTGAFDSFSYDPDNVIDPNQPLQGWSPTVPSLAIGEAAFTDTPPGTQPFDWTRNFQVGQ